MHGWFYGHGCSYFCRKMKSFFGIVLVGFVSVVSSTVYGYGGGGWINAHATFYGGGDASGTMGTYTYIYIYIQISMFYN